MREDNTSTVDLSAEKVEIVSDVANRTVPQHNTLVAVTHSMNVKVYQNISKWLVYPGVHLAKSQSRFHNPLNAGHMPKTESRARYSQV